MTATTARPPMLSPSPDVLPPLLVSRVLPYPYPRAAMSSCVPSSLEEGRTAAGQGRGKGSLHRLWGKREEGHGHDAAGRGRAWGRVAAGRGATSRALGVGVVGSSG